MLCQDGFAKQPTAKPINSLPWVDGPFHIHSAVTKVALPSDQKPNYLLPGNPLRHSLNQGYEFGSFLTWGLPSWRSPQLICFQVNCLESNKDWPWPWLTLKSRNLWPVPPFIPTSNHGLQNMVGHSWYIIRLSSYLILKLEKQ